CNPLSSGISSLQQGELSSLAVGTSSGSHWPFESNSPPEAYNLSLLSPDPFSEGNPSQLA
nr:hypothetical protein [Tanacetum cinerariifolium]